MTVVSGRNALKSQKRQSGSRHNRRRRILQPNDARLRIKGAAASPVVASNPGERRQRIRTLQRPSSRGGGNAQSVPKRQSGSAARLSSPPNPQPNDVLA